MPHVVPCQCGRELRLTNDLLGQRIKCPECARILAVPPTAQEGPGGPAAVDAEIAPKERAIRFRPESGSSLAALDFWNIRAGRNAEIIVLTNDTLYVATLRDKEFKQTTDALTGGVPAKQALAAAQKIIHCDQIVRVEANLHDRFLKFVWKSAPASDEAEELFLCPDRETRDEIIEALHERLGPSWSRDIRQETLSEAISAPLTVVIVVGLLTVGLAFAAHWLEGADLPAAGGRWGSIIRIVGMILKYLGPLGVSLIGAPLIFLGVVWFVMCYRKPPRNLSLTAKPAVVPTAEMTAVSRKNATQSSSIFLPDEPISSVRKSEARGDAWIRLEYRRRLHRQVIVPVSCLGLIGMSFVIGGGDAGKTATFLCMIPLVGFTFWNWRCPACKGYLGKGSNHRFCPKCSVRLKD
jgi:hypothetical protein